MSVAASAISEATGTPKEPMQIGAKHPGYAPYGIYQGKNGSIAIAMLTSIYVQDQHA